MNHVLLRFLSVLILFITCTSAYCSQNSDCENGGECKNNKCQCLVIKWAGEHCEERTETFLGSKYTGYYYTVLVVTLLLFFASAIKLYKVHKASKKFSMVHLAVWMITVALFLRAINYLTEVDGHFFRNDGLEPFSGLCYFLYYPMVLSAYMCELLLWLELYKATTHTSIENLPRYRKVFYAVNGFLFPLEFVTRILLAVYKNTSTAIVVLGVWVVLMGVVVLLESIGFMAIAVLVLRRLSRVKAITGTEHARKTFIQVSCVLIGLAFLLSLGFGMLLFYFLTTDINIFYGLLWFCRIVEYSITAGLLLVIRPPRGEHTSHELSGASRLSRNATPLADVQP